MNRLKFVLVGVIVTVLYFVITSKSSLESSKEQATLVEVEHKKANKSLRLFD